MVKTPSETPSVFDNPDAQLPAEEPADIDAIRDHYADSVGSAMEGRNPYSSSEQIQADRDARKTGTLSPEEIPERLRGTMELAEEHWRKTAPGAAAVAGTKPEVPEEIRKRTAAFRERKEAEKALDPIERIGQRVRSS